MNTITNTETEPVVDWDRSESESCERSTPGCCIKHLPKTEWDCETW